MNIKEIVTDYLKKNEYDGLYHNDQECGCELNDLFPCGTYDYDCTAGYKVDCSEFGDECKWYIGERNDLQKL